MDDGDQDQPSKPTAFFRAAQFASLGLEMGLCVAIGAGLGYWVDSSFGTRPWFMLFFLMCGVAAGFKGLYEAARRATKDAAASKPRGPDGTPPQPDDATRGDDGPPGTQED